MVNKPAKCCTEKSAFEYINHHSDVDMLQTYRTNFNININGTEEYTNEINKVTKTINIFLQLLQYKIK